MITSSKATDERKFFNLIRKKCYLRIAGSRSRVRFNRNRNKGLASGLGAGARSPVSPRIDYWRSWAPAQRQRSGDAWRAPSSVHRPKPTLYDWSGAMEPLPHNRKFILMPNESRNRLDEVMHRCASFTLRRGSRFLVAEIHVPHQVLSTSAHLGGQRDDLLFLANHQSCQASGDESRITAILRAGPIAYHRRVCEEAEIDPDRTALMGTAANMAYAAHRWSTFEDLRVDTVVTAGVSGNAARAGDPAQWKESDEGWQEVSCSSGTINTILILNRPVTPAALARAVVTMTEAKSAALAELAIPSRYSPNIATGTGTDQFCLAAPIDSARKAKESTSPHSKLGELIGVSVREAVLEALRWQNGLEPSSTRSLFHALGRFGLTEERAMRRLAELLPEDSYSLLEKNRNDVFFEPGAAAAAYGFAAVLDRITGGTLPLGLARDALRQQATCLACALAARPEEWVGFRSQLAESSADPVELALLAVALGWKTKWN